MTENGHRSGKVTAELQSKFINPTMKSKQEIKAINILLAPSWLSGSPRDTSLEKRNRK
jgi:hypothetical protein